MTCKTRAKKKIDCKRRGIEVVWKYGWLGTTAFSFFTTPTPNLKYACQTVTDKALYQLLGFSSLKHKDKSTKSKYDIKEETNYLHTFSFT